MPLELLLDEVLECMLLESNSLLADSSSYCSSKQGPVAEEEGQHLWRSREEKNSLTLLAAEDNCACVILDKRSLQGLVKQFRMQMGVHPVEWRGPKLEGLTLELGNPTTDLSVSDRHPFYSSVQEQRGVESRVGSMPRTDICHFHDHTGRTIILAGAENGHHLHGESESTRLPGEFMVYPTSGGHIRSPTPSMAGSELNLVGGKSRLDSWMPERNVLLPLRGIAGLEGRDRGELIYLKDVKVKIEKVEPVDTVSPLSLRTLSLPTDLTPLEAEDVNSSPIFLPDVLTRESEGAKSPPEPVARRLTIDLSDTDSEDSVPCLSSERISYESKKPDAKAREGTGVEEGGYVICLDGKRKTHEFQGSDQKNWVQQSTVPDSTGTTLPGQKSSQHGSSHSLTPKIEGVKPSNAETTSSKSLKRKRSVIDLDSIIDLEEEDSQTPFIPSGSEESLPGGEFTANGSLVKKSESEEKRLSLVQQTVGKTVSTKVPDGKQDLQIQQHGPITDLQVVSNITKARDQQYVFDIARDMDDATMEELMRDDEEDLEAQILLDDNGDFDQNFVISSFDTDCNRFVPSSKDCQEEIPSWYLARARGLEEQIRRPGSDNSEQFSNLGTGCSKGFQQVNAVPHCLQRLSHYSNVSDSGALVPSYIADPAEALRRFVQASSARGTFQPPQVSSASMIPEGVVPHYDCVDNHTEAPSVASMISEGVLSHYDCVDNHTEAPSVVERDVVADNAAVTVRPHGKSALVPKPEPVEVGVHTDSSMDRVVDGAKAEWSEGSAMGILLDGRDRIVNALKTFELGRMVMLQEQANAEGNGKRVRADLKAACSMRKSGMWLNEQRPIGECPGVKVGDCFTYRIEMAIIGLHRAVQAGIAVVPADYCPYGKPVAGSVVMGVNDTYKDDKDMGDTVVYSGQGGLAVDKSGIYQDQKLLRGNLALANSLELGLPVRMIRGHKLQSTNTGILYSYDGLYKVTGMVYDMGVHKNMVYTFHMERIPGQPPIRRPSATSLLYPVSIAPYPVPLKSHASPPVTSQVPQNREQPWLEQAVGPQGGTNQPSTTQIPHYVNGSLTGQCSSSNNCSTQSERQGWTEEYEEKPTLYLLPRSAQQ